MKKGLVSCLIFIMFFGNYFSQELSWTSSRPDGHAPAGVMLDHCHHKGEVMFSYRYMPMFMEGMLDGTASISANDIYSRMYMSSPHSMLMQMHMIGAMYAPSDRITLILMSNYIGNDMDLNSSMGMSFSTASSGFGDVSLGGLIKLINSKRQSVHMNVGLSLPTGSINQRGDTPTMEDIQLAYPMQLGSGTYDLISGLTYLAQKDKWSWGAQGIFTFRTGSNSFGYTLGNRLLGNAWTAFKLTEMVSISGSTSYENNGTIEGASTEIEMPGSMMPMMMPMFNSSNSGREILNIGIGCNIYLSKGILNNLRFGLEAKLPVWQKVNGIQMDQKFLLCSTIQYTI